MHQAFFVEAVTGYFRGMLSQTCVLKYYDNAAAGSPAQWALTLHTAPLTGPTGKLFRNLLQGAATCTGTLPQLAATRRR